MLCACAVACLAVHADCIDELMPRPQIVLRGVDGINATRVAHQGGYTLLVRGGKPKVEGDGEGRRYAQATWAQLKKLAGTGEVPDCTLARSRLFSAQTTIRAKSRGLPILLRVLQRGEHNEENSNIFGGRCWASVLCGSCRCGNGFAGDRLGGR